MTDCQALPLPDHDHAGEIREYFRICPSGHLRRGHVCETCAGNGAVMCSECTGEHPALLVRTEIWARIIVESWELVTFELLSEFGKRELVAEGAGPLLDPDCRDGKHTSCVGAPCECPHHKDGT